MGDLKDQLAAIRSMVKKADTLISDTHRLPSTKKYSAPSKSKSTWTVEDLCILRLPLLGQVKSYISDRAFGFISTGQNDLFFHISGRILDKSTEISGDVRERHLIYVIGSSPKDGRPNAAQWCFVDDIIWPSGRVPRSQQELDQIRRGWYTRQTLDCLFEILRADWYRRSWKDKSPAADLTDAILQDELIAKLKSTSPDEWRQLRVKDQLNSALFTFARDWVRDDDDFVTQSLVENFTAEQLAAYGPPRYKWVLKDGLGKYQSKLFEWALQSRLDDAQRSRWEANLEDDFSWDGEVASRLIASDWIPSEVSISWIHRLVKFNRVSPDIILKRLDRCPDEWPKWFNCLPDPSKVELLARQPSLSKQLVEFLESKADQELHQLALFQQVISIDLESDRETIWEIGCADRAGKHLLLSRNHSPDMVDMALKCLEQKLVNSTIVVGHNIESWDWPILQRRLTDSIPPVLWDTLLVQFMLEPWRVSNALDSTHQADDDAAASLALFQEQLARLGGGIALRALKGEFKTTLQLTVAIADTLQTIDWNPPMVPSGLPKAVNQFKVLVLPPPWIRRFNWVKNFILIPADSEESLDIGNLVLNFDRLSAELRTSPSCGSLGTILSGVLRKAETRNISIRFGMLPIWITEHDDLYGAVRSALAAPQAGHSTFKIANYPKGIDWYLTFDSEKFALLDPPTAAFTVSDQWLRASKLPRVIQQEFVGSDAPRNGALYRWLIVVEPSVHLWTTLDPAARRLSKTGNCWRIFKTVGFTASHETALLRSKVQSWKKPSLLSRGEALLFPGAEDQAAYWKNVLSSLLSVSREQSLGTVSILLISSSMSQELLALLEEALAELECAETRISHHTRRERLARAARIHHGCVVDLIENWPIWRSLGEVAGISLTPVIEALPINDWYATWPSESREEETTIGDPSESDDTDAGGEENTEVSDEMDADTAEPTPVPSARVSASQISALIPDLVKENLGSWLWQIGIADYSQSPVLLDPRVSPRSKDVRQLFEVITRQPSAPDSAQIKVLDHVFEPLQIDRKEPPSDYEAMRAFLERHWNKGKKKGEPGWISDFRESTQKPAMEVIRDRSADVLVTLPTGEGKSVLFQVPALCRGLRTRRLTLVISPLRALMRDQVERLWYQGFHQSVDYLSADRPVHEIEDVFQGVLDHRIILLYVAPERFRNRRFMDLLDRRFESDGAFEYVVVDETHCVSQWGYEFRPDYFYALDRICAKYRRAQATEKSPFVLLSATVTASSRDHLATLIKGAMDEDDARYLPFVARPDQYFHPIRSHITIDPRHVLGRINTKPKADWPIGPRLEVISELINEAKQNRDRTKQHSAVIVFVARRDHAEQLAFLIDKEQMARVDHFHAGLDAETRTDVYTRFKDRSIDVLVATKAFGMGMDISHIHWAVHLAPPTFLEDHLQEVGRVGRGEKERQLAKLSDLKAVLLYSDDDFQTNRTNIQRSRIELRQIVDLYDEIRSRAKEVRGISVALMPDAGYESYVTSAKRRVGCTQVRKTLYWLERLGRVEILTMMPGLLPVRLSLDRLAEIATQETGPVAEVAASLASLGRVSNQQPAAVTATPTATANNRNIVERIIDGLSNLIGFLFGGARVPNSSRNDSVQSQLRSPLAVPTSTIAGDAVINLGQIWRDTSLAHVDDVLSMIVELETRNALQITRKIAFGRGRHSYADPGHIDPLFGWLKQVSGVILRRLKDQPKYVIDFDELGTGFPDVRVSGDLIDVRMALERTTCYLLRSCGVRIRERLVAEDRRELVATLSASKYGEVRNKVKVALRSASELWKVFSPRLDQENREIEVSSLLGVTKSHSGNKRYRESDLRRNLGLLGSMRLVSVSEPLVPMSYVVSLTPSETILDENDHPEVWSELRKVNRLTELRGDAIEIFVHLPPDARDLFIEGYFTKSTPGEMELFLNEQLGLIDEDSSGDSGGFVQQKLAHLRATAVEEFFARYKNEPEEPNQWLAITHPFNRHLIVNAGPGSGKTSVLIARIAHLIRNQHLRPEEILVLAFNRAVVFEIRARIRDLFARLGYGAYVRRLNVSTFHAFATRHLNSSAATNDWNKDRGTLLSRFADKLESDRVFRVKVAGGLRSILIDEFQDVNDDLFRIVHALSTGAGPGTGVMVIGDDDQDILRWNRADRESSDTYFNRFMTEFSVGADDQLALMVNFRSGERIVEETQGLLNNFFRNVNGVANRLKTERLRPATAAPESEALEIERDFASGIQNAAKFLTLTADIDSNHSTAILCRTNNEVAKVFHNLHKSCPELLIQNNVSYPIARLRHIGLWMDLLKEELKTGGDRALSIDLFNRVQAIYAGLDIPEVIAPRLDDIAPDKLWDLCFKESSYPYLSHLIEFVESLDSEDFIRLIGRSEDTKRSIVVSTIHKVKGLEFDQVIVLPSSARFPLNQQSSARSWSSSYADDAAEEARLLYVAMTRAKRHLCYSLGPREKAWLGHEDFEGDEGNGKILSGKPDEVRISWAWKTTDWNRDAEELQRYIEQKVRVGDRLILGGVGRGFGRSIIHYDSKGPGRQIGFTSNSVGPGGIKNNLAVSAVLRCYYNGESFFGGSTAQQIREQGWGLVVMASGVLR